MIALLIGLILTPTLSAAPREGLVYDPAALTNAANTELARALELTLPDQPKPYLVVYEVLDGDVATAGAAFGALASQEHGPYRSLRADLRVGDYALDNSNFDMSFGERDGVQSRALPHDDLEVAMRREIWLATDEAYKGATEQLSAKLSAREGREGPWPADLAQIEPLVTEPIEGEPADAKTVEALVRELSGALAAYDHLETGEAIARDWQGTRMILSTEGSKGWIPTGFTVVRVDASTRAEDGARLRDSRSWVARRPADLPPKAEMLAEVHDMAVWLDGLRTAPVEEDYLGPVIFKQAAAVELFRQLLLPELSGTPPLERAPDPYSPDSRGSPTAREGRRLFPEGWTVVDDPTLEGYAGSYTHDFEGVAAERVELVRDGVVRQLLMSRVPRGDNVQSTGHGRSLGVERRVAIPAVVRVEPARSRSQRHMARKARVLARQAGLSYVLVVGRIEPLALAEDFQVAFSGEGPLAGLTRPLETWRLYADGTVEPVRGLEFLGVDRRALRDIAVAGQVGPPRSVMDAAPGPRRFSIGPVGGLPSTWIVPPVLLTEMELRGHGGQEQRVLPPPGPGISQQAIHAAPE